MKPFIYGYLIERVATSCETPVSIIAKDLPEAISKLQDCLQHPGKEIELGITKGESVFDDNIEAITPEQNNGRATIQFEIEREKKRIPVWSNQPYQPLPGHPYENLNLTVVIFDVSNGNPVGTIYFMEWPEFWGKLKDCVEGTYCANMKGYSLEGIPEGNFKKRVEGGYISTIKVEMEDPDDPTLIPNHYDLTIQAVTLY